MEEVAPSEGLRDALEAAEAASGRVLRVESVQPYKLSWRATSSDAFAYLGPTPAARSLLVREAKLYEWGHGEGVPLPQVIAASDDGSFLVVSRVASDPPKGPDYVAAAAEASDRIVQAKWPPASLLAGGRPRRARLRSAPIRYARMLGKALNPVEISSTTRAVARLPAAELSHGDFHKRNVLFDSFTASVHLIDLEFLGPAPHGVDLAVLWVSLEMAQDRDLVLEALLSRTPRDRRGELGVVLHWAALRFLVEVISLAPWVSLNEERVALGRDILKDARRLRAGWS